MRKTSLGQAEFHTQMPLEANYNIVVVSPIHWHESVQLIKINGKKKKNANWNAFGVRQVIKAKETCQRQKRNGICDAL